MDDVGRGFLYIPVLGNSINVPEPAQGQRVSEHLSTRGARNIKGAAIKASNIGLPMRTFITFTCKPQDRERVAEGSLMLGTEMRRTLNAMQQKFRRERYGDFAYIWVAENPADENPHVHLLTNYRVSRSAFPGFAAWVESLWGHGYAKIEKIRLPEKAGRYILKAAGYVSKGSGQDQGPVYGRRYGISKNVLPVYETHDLFDQPFAAQTIRSLIAEMDGDFVQIDRLFLTHFGLSFPAGSGIEDVMSLIEYMENGHRDRPSG